jgi:N-acyl-D-amino-acid deacylase
VNGADYDLIVRGGRVADGTGNPAFHADVAIRAGRIAAVGKIPSIENESALDARGLVVAPGFIDVHTHAEDILELPLGENFVRMGVTTIVAGNCGSSETDVGEFFRKVEDSTVSPNVATLVGHGSVRSKVMGGSFMRPPTDAEMNEMKALVGQAMKDGALGLSTGLIYLPGTFAKTEEIVDLARVVASYDGIYASHMRDEGAEILDALNELFRVARDARIRAHVSHIKLSGKSNWGRFDEVLGAIERVRAEGLDITQDQYVYTASSTGISQLIPESFREGGKFRERLTDPNEKTRLITEMKARLKARGYEDYSYAVIASYKHDPSLNGLNLVEAARKARGSDSLDDQIEMVIEIQKHGGANGIFHGISEDDLRRFLAHPHTLFASDSGTRRFREGVPHPRGYGNNARVIGRYVRELKLLRLEDAIRRMTSLPASVFRLKDRGLVREGCWADLVIFDPAKVQEEARFNDPHHYATGFAGVLVNGVLVVRDDKHTQARPGRSLRAGR